MEHAFTDSVARRRWNSRSSARCCHHDPVRHRRVRSHRFHAEHAPGRCAACRPGGGSLPRRRRLGRERGRVRKPPRILHHERRGGIPQRRTGPVTASVLRDPVRARSYRRLLVPDRDPVRQPHLRRARVLVDVAAREPRAYRVSASHRPADRMGRTRMTRKLQVLLVSRSATGRCEVLAEGLAGAQRHRLLDATAGQRADGSAVRPRSRCPTCWCCASTPTAWLSSPRWPSRSRTAGRR